MRLFILQKTGYANRYAIVTSKDEVLLIDFHCDTLEDDLDTVLEYLPEPKRVMILQTRQEPARRAARERLELLLPKAESLSPEADVTALAPRRFAGHLLQLLPMGSGLWAFALHDYLFLGATRDARRATRAGVGVEMIWGARFWHNTERDDVASGRFPQLPRRWLI